jgi:hypothetical protein
MLDFHKFVSSVKSHKRINLSIYSKFQKHSKQMD